MVEPTDGSTINKAYLDSGDWQVDIAGQKYPAKVSLRPLYDPSSSKIKV